MSWQPFQTIWHQICQLQGQVFITKKGKSFTYSVKSGTTVWVKRDGHRINQSLIVSNFTQVYSMMQSNPIIGPAEINKRAINNGQSQVRGPSYVWAILHDKRVI